MQQEDAGRRISELRRRVLEQQATGRGGQCHEPTLGAMDRDLVRSRVSMELTQKPRMRGMDKRQVDALCTSTKVDGNDSKKTVTRATREGYGEDTVIDPQVHKSLTDESGHINLFSQKTGQKLSAGDKNPEYEKEKAEKEAKIAEQYNMALGRPAQELRPWYITVDKVGEKQGKKTEKQIGIEKRRDEKFKDLNDPMSVMKMGVKQLKEIEKIKKKCEAERGDELERLKREQGDLEGFSLDGPQAGPLQSYRKGSRSAMLGIHDKRKSRSGDRRPGKEKDRGKRSRSPDSNMRKKRRRHSRDGRCLRSDDHIRDRSLSHNRHSESGRRYHESTERDGKESIRDRERSSRTVTEDWRSADRTPRRKEHHERG